MYIHCILVECSGYASDWTYSWRWAPNHQNRGVIALKKVKIKAASKVTEVKIQRYLFGRLLGIALDENIDIEKANITVRFLI